MKLIIFLLGLAWLATPSYGTVDGLGSNSLFTRRILAGIDEQAEEEESFFTLANNFSSSEMQDSGTLQALAGVLKSPVWYGDLESCWLRSNVTGALTYSDSANCTQILAQSMAQLGNAVITNVSTATEFCNRTIQAKVPIPMLVDTPTSMAGTYMYLLHKLNKTSRIITSMWLTPIPKTRAGLLDECGAPYKGPNVGAPPAPDADSGSESAEKKYAPQPNPPITGSIIENAGKKYRSGLAIKEQTTDWMNVELGVKSSNGLSVGMIFPRNTMLLMYRKDWFDEWGLQPPQTWSELLSLAAQLSRMPQFIDTVGTKTGAGLTNWDQPVDLRSGDVPLAKFLQDNPIASNDTFQTWPAEGAVPMVFHQYSYHGQGAKAANASSSQRKLLQHTSNKANVTQRPLLVPLCLDLAPYCKAGDYLAAISASIIQSQGTQQGYALDPMTLDPLTTNPGFKTALAIYRELVALSLPANYMYQYQPLKSCAGVSRPFARGECAMTLDWDVVWPLVHKMNIPEIESQKQLAGNVGYAPLPGSGVVWNRASNQMATCTKSVCPWSTSEFIPRYSYVPATANTTVSTDRAATAAYVQTNLQSTTEQVFVSRAPYSSLVIREGWLCQPEGFTNNTDFILAVIDTAQKTTSEIRKSTTAMMKNVFLKMMQRKQGGSGTTPSTTEPASAPATTPADQPAGTAPTASPALGRRLRSSDDTAVSHRRRRLAQTTSPSWMMRAWDPISQLSHDIGNLYGSPPLDELSSQTQELLEALKEKPNMVAMNISDVNRMLAALWKSQFTYSANAASQTVLTPSVSGLFIQAYHEAAFFLTTADNATLDDTGWGLSDRMRFTMSLESGGAAAIATALWQVTGYQPPPSPPPPTVAPVSIVVNQEDNKTTITTIAIAVPTTIIALIVIISAGMIVHGRRSSHLSWKGDVLPPGAGPETTLLLTDIQDSTPIWEALPPATVDEALAVHHSTIRAVALKHHGYECSTEGDSFTLAFHNAQSAALFAVEAQQELLLAAWPKEVFEMEVCKPVWVKPQVKGNKPRWHIKKNAQHDETNEQANAASDDNADSKSWWNCFGRKRVAIDGAETEDANTVPAQNKNVAAAPAVFINQLDEPFYVPGSSPLEWSTLTSSLSLSDDLQTTNSIGEETAVVEENEEMFIRDKLLQLAPATSKPGEGCILLFRGLRVRMGMASGVEKTEDITLNTSLGRVCYGGALAAAAKAVQDAAQGAQVLVGQSTFSQLPLQDMKEQIISMEMGWHKLSDIQEPMHLYQLLLPNLIFRAAHFGPVRSVSQESLGSTQAPYGKVAIAHMNIVGLGLLKSQDAELADASMAVFQQVSESYLARLGGYLQMSSDGLCLTAFSHPAEAVRWALDTIKACLVADWPEALLEHEMGEVLKVPIMAPHLLQQADYLAETPRTPVRSSFAMGHRSSRPIGVRTSVPLELNDRGSPINTRPFMTPAKPGMAAPSAIGTATEGIQIKVPIDEDNFDERNTFNDLLKMKGKDKAAPTNWPVVVHKVVLRGLRMKCGIDYGPVKSGVHGLTARSTYTGKVLNRAARVSQNAKTGQVWLTEAAWEAARNEVNVIPEPFDDAPAPPPAPEVAATHLGAFKLKGVPEEIHLVQTFFCDSPATAP